MKKYFLVLSIIILGLFAGMKSMRAGIIDDIFGSLGSLGPDDFYYTQLVATPSPASSGTVQLIWMDMMGDTVNANKIEDPDEKAEYEYKYSLLNPGASGYSNPTGYGDRAQLVGTTILYGDMEAPLGDAATHVYVTSFAYFKAEAQPAEGWYFDGWSYIDNGQIQKLDTLRSGENVLWPTDENPNTNRAVFFRIKPHNQKGTKYLDPSAVSQASYDSTFRYVQANFKPVLLTGYRGGKGEIEVGQVSTTFDVYVTIEAKKENLTVNDFENPILGNTTDFAIVGMEPGYDVEAGVPYAKVSLQFTAPAGIEAGKFYKTTLTASSKGGSTIDVPIEVRAVAADRTEATLYNEDKTVAANGNLLSVVIPAISGTTQTLQLNKTIEDAIPLTDKTVKLDLNGYNIASLTINSGAVTISYSKYGGECGALNVAGGKAILNGGTFASLTIANGATVEQNGATITGATTNNGTMTTTEGVHQGGLTSNGTLTLNGGTFKGETAVTIAGGKAAIKRGTLKGTECGLLVSGGSATVEKLATITGETYAAQCTGGTLTINNGKFGNVLNGTITLESGYFVTNNIGIDMPEGKDFMNVSAGVEYEEGYRFFVGNTEDALNSGVGVCRIGSTSYARLEDAIAYANNNPQAEGLVILMTNNYTLPAGYYTLPANATIVVPMDAAQDNSNSVVRRTVKAYQKPTEFRRLTFASGVKMEVFGAIEVSCTQHAYDVGNGGYNSNPWGPYGHLVLEEDTKLTLQDGAHIYAWGFITGKGEIDARRGSTVHEQFQMGDWKGGTTSFGMLSDARGVFPVTQYWIQNVEAPAKFHPGAILTASAAVSVLNGMVVAYANDINIVGVNGRDDAMFLLDNEADAENTWVRKWYDNETDYQMYQVNNTAHIGSLVLKLGKLGDMNLDMNSATFKLPITNNMNIHLLSGFMDFTQDTYLLPGAVVEVDKESVVSITKVADPNVHSGSLYIYDADDWGNYIIDKNGDDTSKKYTKAVPYEPITGGRPHIRAEKKADGQNDATVLVHGQFDTADGYVFTSNGGASIISTNEDAGTFTFTIDAKPADYTEEVYHADGTSINGIPDIFSPAQLRNADGVSPAFSQTGGMEAGKSYCYMNNRWTQMAIDPDDKNFMREWFGGDLYGAYYIKPSEYVAVNATKIYDSGDNFVEIKGNDDHTFSDADGAGRLFILITTEQGFSQWWEVEKIGNDSLYHCIHPENDTYYYWDEVEECADPTDPSTCTVVGSWKEKRYTITWKNWDGTVLETINEYGVSSPSYSVTYGTQAEYLGTNPTREATIDYTYDFTGWNPQPGKVTSDVTYTATYTEKERKYTIIFQQEGGVEIERQFLTHNAFPVCENTPTKIGHILQWSPAISAVIGDATYTATWLEEPPTKYEIRFVDYDGTLLINPADSVEVGELPIAPAIVGGKPEGAAGRGQTEEFTYVFDHWSPAIQKVTEAVTYTAVYREEARLYTIIFQNENGTPIETKKYQYGETPVCSSTPTRDNTAQYSYTFSWTPQIQSVMGDATYRATFAETTNQYVVTLKSNPSGACTLSGAGNYPYGTNVDVSLTANTGYTFTGWSDGQEGTETSRTVTVNDNINLVANFTVDEPDYIITWKNEAGTANLVDPVGQKANTATTYTGATPTKDAANGYTYIWDGWTTAANGAGTYYKKGMTPRATANATYYAHFTAEAIPSLEIANGAQVVLTAPVTYQNLVLTSNGTTSGQLLGSNYLTLSGDAYFDYAINAKARTWYQVAVPWQVNAENGIYVNGQQMRLGGNFDILYYDSERRAAMGINGNWKYLELEKSAGNRMMEPGMVYLIAFTCDAPVIRFKANDKDHLLTTTAHVDVYDTEVPADRSWNGVSNPALFHAYVNAGTEFGQVYNSSTNSFDLLVMSAKPLVVGQGAYVQVPDKKTITVTNGGTYSAMRRRAKAADEKAEANYEVHIMPMGQNDYADRLFARTNENKNPDVYTVGQDVGKMSTSTAAVQMWIDRYDTKLCVNAVAPVNGQADYPLGIYAPENGDYTMCIKYTANSNSGYDLFLTKNGESIWNISRSAYVLELEKGTTAEYGLRVVAKAPQITTDVEETTVVENNEKDLRAAKVLINDHVFILRDGKIYTITGQTVKNQ